jgi:hypothetical protein
MTNLEVIKILAALEEARRNIERSFDKAIETIKEYEQLKNNN